MLTSKLSRIPLFDSARDADRPSEDLEAREAIEVAKRAVLEVLEGGRMVDVTVLCAVFGAGVDCSGEGMLSKGASRTSCEDAESSGRSSESSKGGRDGREGMSLPSIASILLHTRDGVSSMASIVAGGVEASDACLAQNACDHMTVYTKELLIAGSIANNLQSTSHNRGSCHIPGVLETYE